QRVLTAAQCSADKCSHQRQTVRKQKRMSESDICVSIVVDARCGGTRRRNNLPNSGGHGATEQRKHAGAGVAPISSSSRPGLNSMRDRTMRLLPSASSTQPRVPPKCPRARARKTNFPATAGGSASKAPYGYTAASKG